ncbi:hypothetical protein BGX28_006088 [Mortierella sp. GBA30]|nr:hypothetical protein BGX28_006088 [Mortierella sp. GBA30]
MATLVSQTPIAIHNPFSVLESEFTISHHIADEEEQDLSTWCVVNSPDISGDSRSEEEQDEDDLDDVIYDWDPSPGENNNVAAGKDICLSAPLRLSPLSDGFTNVSRAITARSINSALAYTSGHRGDWVIKVSRPRHSNNKSLPTIADTNTTTIMISCTESSSKVRSEKRKDTSERRSDNEDEDGDETLYMAMTEHELSKSSKASKMMKNRVAMHHSRELARALGCLSEEADKIDKKAVRSRSNKSRNKSRTSKPKVLPSDF